MADFVRRGRYSEVIRAAVPRPVRRVDLVGRSGDLHAFPALAYARFMDNHGLLEVAGRPEWRTVTGGSRRYVEALTAPFSDRIQARHARAQDRHSRRRRQLAPRRSAHRPRPGALRPCDRGDAQRPGAAHACRRDAPPSARSSARSAISATSRRCTPTNECCRATRARERAGTTRSIANARGTTVTYWMNRLQSIETPTTATRHAQPPRRDRPPHA